MYETTISVNAQKQNWLCDTTELNKTLTANGGIMATAHKNERIYISFAIQKNKKIFLNKLISNYIAECYCVNAKREFITSNIKLKESPLNTLFFSVLVRFDTESETTLVIKNVGKIKDFSLDGFYYFRLQELHERWCEICELAKSNLFLINNYENMCELLRFLLSTIRPKIDEIEVHKDGDGFSVLAKKPQNINTYIENTEKLLDYFITIAPLKITIVGDIIPQSAHKILTSLFVTQ